MYLSVQTEYFRIYSHQMLRYVNCNLLIQFYTYIYIYEKNIKNYMHILNLTKNFASLMAKTSNPSSIFQLTQKSECYFTAEIKMSHLFQPWADRPVAEPQEPLA